MLRIEGTPPANPPFIPNAVPTEARYGEESYPLVAEGISADVRHARILEGVTLLLPARTITGILGPNGAGKTTLLRALAGTIRLSAGDVTLYGNPVSSYPRRQLAQLLGVIPQHTDFTLELTVREIVGMGRFCHRPVYAKASPEDEAVVEASLKTLQLTALADRPAYTLSGGERQRMFLAQLLAQAPNIVLLDETTAHLDPKYQGDLLRMLRALVVQQGWTAVIVLHDLPLAYRFCDYLAFIREGRLLASGAASEMAHPEIIRAAFDIDARFRRDGDALQVHLVY